jgi:hypothetical protein
VLLGVRGQGAVGRREVGWLEVGRVAQLRTEAPHGPSRAPTVHQLMVKRCRGVRPHVSPILHTHTNKVKVKVKVKATSCRNYAK